MGMKTSIPSAADLQRKLETLEKEALLRLADLSGVPFHTLRKIKSGETKDPGIETVRRFAPYIAKAKVAA